MEFKANDYSAKDILRFIRESAGETQKSFGSSIGKTERTIQAYESGYRHCTVDTLLEIIKKHNIKIIVKDNKKDES